MKFNSLPKIVARAKKRLGQGIGSGKGKTAGRGTKGQKARGKIPAGFTGSLALYKKLPLKKGKGQKQGANKPVIITLNQLNVFKDKSEVNLLQLLEAKLLTAKEARNGVKVLSKGELKAALTVSLPLSAAARLKIEKAGGKVVNV